MFAIPGVVLLLVAIYARPQELYGPLESLPLLHALFALTAFGMVLDWRLGHTRLRNTPLTPWALLFVFWAYFSVLLRAPQSAPDHTLGLAICATLYLIIAHGVHTFRALGAVAGALLAMVILVCSIAVEQRFAPTGCIEIDESVPGDTTTGSYDGRACETTRECYFGNAEPGAQYMCEHVGLLGTTSVGQGRVRYRGVLQDPNELALAGAIGLPLAFAISRTRRRSISKRVLLVATFLLVLVCSVLTGSRSGQLVFLAVLAVPLSRRLGVRGIIVGAILAAPLLALGGRAGAEAATSVSERVDCWAEALSIWRAHPLLGAGLGQFGQYHYLTAHNSYLLTLAELGPAGMLLFSMLVYVAAKIPWVAWQETMRPGTPLSSDAALVLVRPWAMSVVAAIAGLAVGMFFLSFSYHYVLWIYLGLSGALYSSIRAHDESFTVPISWRDFVLVACVDVAIIVLVYGYARLQG